MGEIANLKRWQAIILHFYIISNSGTARLYASCQLEHFKSVCYLARSTDCGVDVVSNKMLIIKLRLDNLTCVSVNKVSVRVTEWMSSKQAHQEEIHADSVIGTQISCYS